MPLAIIISLVVIRFVTAIPPMTEPSHEPPPPPEIGQVEHIDESVVYDE